MPLGAGEEFAAGHDLEGMALGDVCDFMAEDTRELVVVRGEGIEPARDKNVSAGCGEGIDRVAVEDAKTPFEIRAV